MSNKEHDDILNFLTFLSEGKVDEAFEIARKYQDEEEDAGDWVDSFCDSIEGKSGSVRWK